MSSRTRLWRQRREHKNVSWSQLVRWKAPQTWIFCLWHQILLLHISQQTNTSHHHCQLCLLSAHLSSWHCLWVHGVLLNSLAAFHHGCPERSPHRALAWARWSHDDHSHSLLQLFIQFKSFSHLMPHSTTQHNTTPHNTNYSLRQNHMSMKASLTINMPQNKQISWHKMCHTVIARAAATSTPKNTDQDKRVDMEQRTPKGVKGRVKSLLVNTSALTCASITSRLASWQDSFRACFKSV